MRRKDEGRMLVALLARARSERRIGVEHSGSRYFPPTKLSTVRAAEKKLGVAFPELLVRIYTEVANGCIGPGYGLAGLAGGYKAGEKGDLVPMALDFRRAGNHPDLLPGWHWGCGIWTCIELSSSKCGMVYVDTHFGPIASGFTLASWLSAWLDGQDLWAAVYEDGEREILNPFTRQPMPIKVAGRAKGTPWIPPVPKAGARRRSGAT